MAVLSLQICVVVRLLPDSSLVISRSFEPPIGHIQAVCVAPTFTINIAHITRDFCMKTRLAPDCANACGNVVKMAEARKAEDPEAKSGAWQAGGIKFGAQCGCLRREFVRRAYIGYSAIHNPL